MRTCLLIALGLCFASLVSFSRATLPATEETYRALNPCKPSLNTIPEITSTPKQPFKPVDNSVNGLQPSEMNDYTRRMMESGLIGHSNGADGDRRMREISNTNRQDSGKSRSEAQSTDNGQLQQSLNNTNLGGTREVNPLKPPPMPKINFSFVDLQKQLNSHYTSNES